MEVDAVERDFLVEGLHDWIGLWRFARGARDDMPSPTDDTVRDTAMIWVRRLVLGGYMRPGCLIDADPGFEPWDLDASAAVERICDEWRALGRDPNIPDICWFENTPTGNALAAALA